MYAHAHYREFRTILVGRLTCNCFNFDAFGTSGTYFSLFSILVKSVFVGRRRWFSSADFLCGNCYTVKFRFLAHVHDIGSILQVTKESEENTRKGELVM